ncbi:Calreticulin family protein [Tritrichomonas foetus]|uniref:Calreticulin family protein n=1 Tax=Tritrichomonas foetus TaxID=1144522 RepID=A0A1J4KPU9_9EUKA|nr:Calreticulin family protein [Tritrichomonas foetus]|eukprot:OHT13267.1 Calreticulin family protein [Tritrichomonas foetus]
MIFILHLFIHHAFSEVYFEEHFNRGWEKRWTKSSRGTPGKLMGRFRVSAGSYYADRRLQRGLQTLDDGREYLISSKFKKCFNTTGKDLIFQFSVKLEGKIEKGQAYLKLLPESTKQNAFSKKSPFSILFGPDFRGWDRRHLEFRVLRNRTDYRTMQPILAFNDQFSHVYTLIIYKNQSYKILKDNFTDIESTLEDAFNYCQPREIPDPYELKPLDWEDAATIDDPDDIPPPWLKDVPQYIPDETAKRPDDWDDSQNGAWTPPLIPNPDFRKDWKPRQIPNPAFRGDWEPKMIPNPDYNPDCHFGKPEDLCFVGIDVEQDVAGSIWDNILVTDDFAYSQKVMEETFFAIQEGERLVYARAQQKGEQQQKQENVFGGGGQQNDRLPSEL